MPALAVAARRLDGVERASWVPSLGNSPVMVKVARHPGRWAQERPMWCPVPWWMVKVARHPERWLQERPVEAEVEADVCA